MYPEIQIAGKIISSYAIFALLGALVSILYCFIRAKRLNLSTEDLMFMLGYGFIGALVGAKSLYIFPRISEIVNNHELIFASLENTVQYFFSGFVFYGGLIGMFIGFFVYAHEFKVDISEFLIYLVPAIPLFHVFGRIGCFMSGCCFGVESSGIFSVAYHTEYAFHTDANRIPVQLIEALGNACVFLFLHFYSKTNKQRKDAIFIYLIIYSLMRFSLEFLRGDQERGVFILSTSQWISILLLCISIYFIHNSDAFWYKIKTIFMSNTKE